MGAMMGYTVVVEDEEGHLVPESSTTLPTKSMAYRLWRHRLRRPPTSSTRWVVVPRRMLD